MKSNPLRIALLCCSIAALGGCAHDGRTVPVTAPKPGLMSVDQAMRVIGTRGDWTTFPPIDVPRNPQEQSLKDLTIVIDPGHGGEDGGGTSTKPAGYKAGPTGEREAYMNLRVSLLLERLLKDAGADVIMTRHGDDSVGLSERAQIANRAKRKRDGGVGADLFVSIHHNTSDSPASNYPSVWYHGEVDDNEPDMDVARYLSLELGKAMRTQVARTSPILSSQLMYGSGFGVLRACDVPAVLCECSFYSNPAEEQRLRDGRYNLREAYAIYTGLCEWAYCGRPTQSTPVLASTSDGVRLTTTLDEGLPQWWGSDRNRIVSSSVRLTLDGKDLPIEFDPLRRTLAATISTSALAGSSGKHVLMVHHANSLANHNWPQRYGVTWSEGRAAIELLPPRRPSRAPATRGSLGRAE